MVRVLGMLPSSSRARRFVAYLGDTRHGSAGSDESIGSVTQLLHLLLGETMLPKLRVVLVVLSLPHRPAGDLFGEGFVRLDLIVIGIGLSAGLDAIGEDFW